MKPLSPSDLTRTADELRILGRLPQAEENLREAIARDENYAPAHYGLGQVLKARGKGHYDAAIAQFARAAALWKNQASKNRNIALINWADTLRILKRFDEAQDKYQEVITDDPRDAAALNGLGMVLQSRGRDHYEAAIGQFTLAAALLREQGSKDRKIALSNWADTLRLLERFTEAADKCREAIAVDADYAGAYNGLGLALRSQGRDQHVAAIEQFAQAAALWTRQGSQDRKIALQNWGDTLRLLERFAEAADKCREAIAVDADYAAAYNGLGLALKGQSEGHYEAAIEQFTRAAVLLAEQGSKDRKIALSNWADTLRLLERFREAEDKYREAIAVDADYAVAHNGLGLILQSRGKDHYGAAIEEFTRTAALLREQGSKDRKIALSNWADTLRLLERFREAEDKYREAIAVDEEYAAAYNGLGVALKRQGKHHYEAAIKQFARADALWAKQGSRDQKLALWNWGMLHGELEDYDSAIGKFRHALEVDSKDPYAHFYLANGLADAALYREALVAYDAAIARDSRDPYSYHNKAYYLFYLGDYQKGWAQWKEAKKAYEIHLGGQPRRPTDQSTRERAVYFASIVRGYFNDLEQAERLYLAVLSTWPDDADALQGLATLYYQWAHSEHPSSTAVGRLSYSIERATRARKSRLGTRDAWKECLSLADLCIDTENFADAQEWLDQAKAMSGTSRSRQAEVAGLYGVLYAKRNRHELAVECFRDALRVRPDNLKLRANLAEALLKQKDFDRSELEFKDILSIAPGNVEALIGQAQLCIELAESGDVDRYAQAEEALKCAVRLGARSWAGSKRLTGRELARVQYLLGFVRVRRCEIEPAGFWLLALAERDFRSCVDFDPSNYRARSALRKLRRRVTETVRRRLGEFVGSLAICLFSASTFLFAQLDFFFEGRLPFGLPGSHGMKLLHPGYYALVTFGSLLFFIAGLYLPRVMKLKVAGIELEKGPVQQISAPATLGISLPPQTGSSSFGPPAPMS